MNNSEIQFFFGGGFQNFKDSSFSKEEKDYLSKRLKFSKTLFSLFQNLRVWVCFRTVVTAAAFKLWVVSTFIFYLYFIFIFFSAHFSSYDWVFIGCCSHLTNLDIILIRFIQIAHTPPQSKHIHLSYSCSQLHIFTLSHDVFFVMHHIRLSTHTCYLWLFFLMMSKRSWFHICRSVG